MDVYRRIIDAISRGDADSLDELVAPDVVDHNPIPDQAPGLDGVKQWLAAARTAFPDLRGTVEDVVVEGDRLAARVTWYAHTGATKTHRGSRQGSNGTARAMATENKQKAGPATEPVRLKLLASRA
jgi:ketosteroid isomerase-like protein